MNNILNIQVSFDNADDLLAFMGKVAGAASASNVSVISSPASSPDHVAAPADLDSLAAPADTDSVTDAVDISQLPDLLGEGDRVRWASPINQYTGTVVESYYDDDKQAPVLRIRRDDSGKVAKITFTQPIVGHLFLID